MLTELSLIKLFLNYELWDKYSRFVEAKDFPNELQNLYRCLDSYHKHNEDKIDLHLLDLGNIFFSTNPKDKEYYQKLFDNLESYSPNVETCQELIKSLRNANLLRRMSILSYEVAEGNIKKQEELSRIVNEYNTPVSTPQETQDPLFVSDDLEEIVNETVAKPGLRWRLATLNRSLGSLRKGDFGFIFARPETGKTTFLASEVSFMAQQVQGPILWINNEEQGSKVMLRLYQASFGLSLSQLYANPGKYKAEFKEKFRDKIKLYDSATVDKKTVEKLCKELKPSLIIFDQIDKIKGFDADREDLRLGAIYIWARELAKEFCPVIGVCQADGTGEGVRWLTMANVANAKTSKQAEADWILGIGKIHDTGWENFRFLHLSKNKLIGDSDSDTTLRHGKLEVIIDADIARYRDLK